MAQNGDRDVKKRLQLDLQKGLASQKLQGPHFRWQQLGFHRPLQNGGLPHSIRAWRTTEDHVLWKPRLPPKERHGWRAIPPKDPHGPGEQSALCLSKTAPQKTPRSDLEEKVLVPWLEGPRFPTLCFNCPSKGAQVLVQKPSRLTCNRVTRATPRSKFSGSNSHPQEEISGRSTQGLEVMPFPSPETVKRIQDVNQSRTGVYCYIHRFFPSKCGIQRTVLVIFLL